jgi:hypothetical protein
MFIGKNLSNAPLDAEAEEKVGLMQNIAEYKNSTKTIEKWIKDKARELHLG